MTTERKRAAALFLLCILGIVVLRRLAETQAQLLGLSATAAGLATAVTIVALTIAVRQTELPA